MTRTSSASFAVSVPNDVRNGATSGMAMRRSSTDSIFMAPSVAARTCTGLIRSDDAPRRRWCEATMRPRRGGRGGLRLAAAAFAFVTSVLLLLAGTSAPAHAQSSSVQASDVAEAWYSSVPVSTCRPPLPCPPSQVPSSPYPADTLQVGVAGGRETARTYVVPDLSVVPYGAVVSSAVMTLPVASGARDGSVRPETARLKACFGTQTFEDGTEGSSAAPPVYDANTCVPAPYSALDLGYTVDLSTFFTRWNAGAPNDGIALVPDLTKAGP